MDLLWLILIIPVIILLLLILFKIYLKLTWGKCKSTERMNGKTVIVTGSNSGIGYECALDLAGRGARVILACRSASKGNEARDKIVAQTGNNNVHVQLVDMSSLQSVRDFAKNILSSERFIHVLVNNAGAGGLGNTKTIDGLPPGLQVNHYAPFLLTNLLLGRLKESAPSRIVTVSSALHEFEKFNVEDINQEKWRSHSEFYTYNNSKLLNVFMSNELARKLEGTGVTSNTLHPGLVKTEFLRDYPVFSKIYFATIGTFFKTPAEGAQTQIYLSVDPDLVNTTGKYFVDCKPTKTSSKANDTALAKKVWEFSEKMVQLQDSERLY